MYKPFLAVALATASLSLAACGGANSLTPNTVTLPAQTTDSSLPLPFSPASSLADLHAVSLPQADVSDAEAADVRPRSQAGPFFAVGVQFKSGVPNTGLFAVQTAYSTAQMQLAYPAGGDGAPERLIGPSMAPTNTCLTSDTIHVNYGGTGPGIGGGPQSFYRTVDACTAGLPKGGIVLTPIDAAFESSYVRLDAGKTPVYVTEIYSPDPFGSHTARWFALLWNFNAKHWDVVRKSVNSKLNTPNPAYVVAWAEYLKGPCPAVPPIYARNIEQYDTKSKHWSLASDLDSEAVVPGGPDPFGMKNSPACFDADATGPATYAFSMPVVNSMWQIQAPNVTIPLPTGS